MNDTRENAARIQELIDEVIFTFRQLRTASAEIHGGGAPMPGERGVLVDLARLGPQTVANMARARAVSRQHIQTLVDRFRVQGLVELAENPNHRRSRLAYLTRSGRALVQRMIEREIVVLGSLDLAIAPARIRNAVVVLQTLRQRLQGLSLERFRGKPVLHRRGSK